MEEPAEPPEIMSPSHKKDPQACVKSYNAIGGLNATAQIYYRSQQSIIQTETTEATDEDKKHLERIPSSERE